MLRDAVQANLARHRPKPVMGLGGQLAGGGTTTLTGSDSTLQLLRLKEQDEASTPERRQRESAALSVQQVAWQRECVSPGAGVRSLRGTCRTANSDSTQRTVRTEC
eukprot:19405-Heterococcus_DN1.PRE.2